MKPVLSPAEQQSWAEAACNFELNTDFDIGEELDEKFLPLNRLMDIMKAQSEGKRSIQALGDKILLHGLLANLDIKQMPLLFSCHGEVNASEVEQMVEEWENADDEEAFDVVGKPTHLSNSSGTLVLSDAIWQGYGWNAGSLVKHIETCFSDRAQETESAALQSLIPGFIVQPRYMSDLDFGFPIEVRVITLWGKTRVGIWWWGVKSGGGKNWERNAWFVQQQEQGDQWKVITDATYRNPEYESALKLITQAMPTMAQLAETIATAVGAPFLRSDFFVGSSKWGLRLNEVAYGSNIELRRLANTAPGYADDAPAVSSILQQGFDLCRRQPPEHFLGSLGVSGGTYEPAWWKFWNQRDPGMQVSKVRRYRKVVCI